MEEKKRTKPDFTAIYRDIPKKWLVVLWAAVAVIALALCFEYSLRSVAREMAEAQGDSLAAEAFIDWVDRMNAALDIPKYVTGIRRSDIPQMAAHADAEANPLYPVPILMDRLELEHMYEVVAGGMFEDEN